MLLRCFKAYYGAKFGYGNLPQRHSTMKLICRQL